MNRFFDTAGDVSRQLAPWELIRMDLPIKATFELLDPIRFLSDVAGGIVVVPVGMLSDLASIPQFAWSIFLAPDDPRIELGAWVHDLLYWREGAIELEGGRMVQLTRDQCDHILAFEAMPVLGASKVKQWAVYLALRWFGDRWKQQT